jgi:chromosome partitioning protein
MGVLPTLFDSRPKHSRAVLETISAAYDIEVLEPPIPRSIRFAEAPAAGRSIFRTARSTRGAQAYRTLAENLVRSA